MERDGMKRREGKEEERDARKKGKGGERGRDGGLRGRKEGGKWREFLNERTPEVRILMERSKRKEMEGGKESEE